MKRIQVHAPRRAQAGLTLIELLVAMTVGLVVTLIALAMLVMGRGGYTAVDATTQLVDKERFATDLITRVVSQTGFEDLAAPVVSTRAIAASLGAEPEPDIFAWDNTVYGNPADPLNTAISTWTHMPDGSRTGCSSANPVCSDVLMVRFQGTTGSGTSTTADMSMINCRGSGEASLLNNNLNTRAISFFHIERDATTGEPSLACATYAHPSGPYTSTPVLEGVESLQVLFGTDDVVPSTPPTTTATDSITDRWLRADQLKVTGNPVATRENFRRVRAVRIGLVLRGPPGSAQERVASTLAPLGSPTFSVSGNNDPGSRLNVSADGRLRRVATFTVHIRNELALR